MSQIVERTLNSKAICEALGIDPASLTRYAKRSDFPCEITAGGQRLHNLEEVKTYLELNNLGKRRNLSSPPVTKAPQNVSSFRNKPILEPDDPMLLRLKSGNAEPLEISQIAIKVVSKQIAEQAAYGQVQSQAFESMNRILEELRKAEAHSISNAVRKGELIERSNAMDIIGTIAQRCVQIANNICNAFTLQSEMWDGDTNFQKLSIEERKRARLDWANTAVIGIRSIDVKEIERMLAEKLQTPANLEDNK